LEAAWAVVCAHFALGDVRQELQGRFEARSAGSNSSSISGGYVAGVPFIGDGWEQDGGAAANSAAAAGVTSFSGSLGAFVDEVLQLLAPPAAACHVAALVEVLPVDAFARLAAQLLPPTAFDAASAAAAQAAAPSIPGLQKSLLKLYSSVAELPDAATAVQLLAAAAPQLPIDRLPAFLVAGWEVCEGLQRMPWLPCAVGTGPCGVGAAASGVKDVRFGTGYAWNNAWPMSSSSSSGGGGVGDGAAALGAQGHFELLVAAAAAGKDSAALQQMLAVLVRQLPVEQAGLALDVLGGGVSDAAFAAAADALQQRRNAAAAGAAAAVTDALTDAFAGQVVWQMGQSDAAAADGSANAAAAVARWGTDKHQDDPAAAAAAAAAGFAADQVLAREVVRLVEAIPAAVPAGSLPLDAMQVRIATHVPFAVLLMNRWC
jgi:hypothetical protein